MGLSSLIASLARIKALASLAMACVSVRSTKETGAMCILSLLMTVLRRPTLLVPRKLVFSCAFRLSMRDLIVSADLVQNVIGFYIPIFMDIKRIASRVLLLPRLSSKLNQCSLR